MLGAIVLAAGSSKRFGGDKRRVKLNDEFSVLSKTIDNVANLVDSVLVVLRVDDQGFKNELRNQVPSLNVSYYLAPDSALGMGHSLSNAINTQDNLTAAMIVLADMPFVRRKSIKLLISTYMAHADSTPIVIPTLHGKFGHPVIFDQVYFEEMSQLKGDRGAKPIIDAHKDKIITIELEDLGTIRDIDTPRDF